MGIRSSLLSVLATVFLAGSLYAQTPNTKVAVISLQGALVGTKDGQKAAQELEAKFTPKQKDSRLVKTSSSISQARHAGSIPKRISSPHWAFRSSLRKCVREWARSRQLPLIRFRISS